MKIAAAILASVPMLAHAGLYVELGIAKADGATCIRDYKLEYNPVTSGCSSNPLGNATLGYEWRNFHAEVEHWSSFEERDKGLNLFTLKYRYEFNK